MKQTDLTELEKRQILKQYLGKFAIYFDSDEEKLFQEKLKNLNNSVILSNNFNLLKKAICYVLLSFNKKINYLCLKSNDILDIMLNDDNPESTSFNDIQEVSFLIIYHPKIWKKNKIMWETLNYLLEVRKNEGKLTVIISDSNRLSDEHGFLEADNIVRLDNIQNIRIPVSISTNDIYS